MQTKISNAIKIIITGNGAILYTIGNNIIKPAKIFNKTCPAIILAPNLKDKLMGLAR